jgi:type IV pilus assembly protein PilB
MEQKTNAKTADRDAVAIVERIIADAVGSGATDIHFIPTHTEILVRFREDRMVRGIETLPLDLHESVVTRIKVLADLVVYKKNIPQEGRLVHEMSRGLKDVELRVTVFPTIHGEKVSIRILDSNKPLLELGHLGFSKKLTEDLARLLSNPQGMVLLTGPAGSGKTTTIYAAIRWLQKHRKELVNILSIEDPVEFDLENISQTEVDSNAGLSFSGALRSMVRQDPDVIVIGEIRDKETAAIAIEAGLTGHLVLSTLHSGTAAGVFVRLLEMDMEPFLIASSVIGALSQRLVRVICPDCEEPYAPPAALLKELGMEAPKKKSRFRRGKGCPRCKDTGYRGLTAIGELLVVTDNISDLILQRSRTDDLATEAVRQGMMTLRQDGLCKVLQGATTFEELYRVLMHKLPQKD